MLLRYNIIVVWLLLAYLVYSDYENPLSVGVESSPFKKTDPQIKISWQTNWKKSTGKDHTLLAQLSQLKIPEVKTLWKVSHTKSWWNN